MGAQLAPFLPQDDMFELLDDSLLLTTDDVIGLFPEFDLSEYSPIQINTQQHKLQPENSTYQNEFSTIVTNNLHNSQQQQQQQQHEIPIAKKARLI